MPHRRQVDIFIVTMTDEHSSTERNRNIWAPWRIEYINALSEGDDGCFLCRYRDDTGNDAGNLVLWRGKRSFAVLNRFPYTGGHSMVAPYEHAAGLDELDAETITEMMFMVRDLQKVLTHSIRAQGFNIGINVGKCAGAGLPGHLHIHIVPRWSGDTNFMAVFAAARVIPQSLEDLYAMLLESGKKLSLPKLAD